MTPDDAYEQWKNERAKVEASTDIEATILEQLDDDVRTQPQPGWQRPLLGAAALTAASIVGMARVALTFFVGIQAN